MSVFSDRIAAGHALAGGLEAFLSDRETSGRILVLALPRGGVPVAEEVAARLDGELDIIVARKVAMPGHPEFGVGAVTADGPPVFNHDVLAMAGLSEADLAPLVAAERREAQRRLRAYRHDRPMPVLTGRTVIVVDDGLATGVTAIAALRQARAQNPAQLVFAAPVCSVQGAQNLRTEADAVICLQTPAMFHAVGKWYEDFSQLSDEDVDAILTASRVPAGRRRENSGRPS